MTSFSFPAERDDRDYEAMIDRNIRRSSSTTQKRKLTVASSSSCSPSSAADGPPAKISKTSSSTSPRIPAMFEKDGRFHCGFEGCLFSGSTYQSVNSHKRHHMERSGESPKPMTFVCPICDKVSVGECFSCQINRIYPLFFPVSHFPPSLFPISISTISPPHLFPQSPLLLIFITSLPSPSLFPKFPTLSSNLKFTHNSDYFLFWQA